MVVLFLINAYNVSMPRILKKKLRLSEAEKLLRLREELKLNQREMAKKLNVSCGAIAHWELGNRTIPGSVLLLMKLIKQNFKNIEGS